jgi:uncharacterized protein (TIGR00369 family)
MSDALHPPEPSGFDPARMFQTMEKFGHSAAIGMRYGGHGDDWAEIRLPWQDALVGDVAAGTVASGAIIALMDMTAGLSVWTRIQAFRPMVTLDLRIDYLRAAAPKTHIIGHVQCTRVAREVAFIRGAAHDGDATDPVAHVAGSFMFTGPIMFR